MIRRRPADERGVTKRDWLESRHTFSFDAYHDPNQMGFGDLRVINEDHVKPASGFGTHPHYDMEIVTVILEGVLEHKDSLGNGAIIRAGEIQRMSAGTGVTHSEFNPSQTEPVHFLQIWIRPEKKGLSPSYEQRAFPHDEVEGRLRLVASHDGREGSITLHQAMDIFRGRLSPPDRVVYSVRPGHPIWVQVIQGTLSLNNTLLHAGDGVGIQDEQELVLQALTDTDVLLFDQEASHRDIGVTQQVSFVSKT